MDYMIIFKAVLTRLFFFAHGIVSIYLYHNRTNKNTDLLLVIPLVFLLIESAVTIVHRKGEEYLYVWPSGFFYITAIIPIVWMTELDLLYGRIVAQSREFTSTNFTSLTFSQQEMVRGKLLLESLKASNFVTAKKVCELGMLLVIVICRWLMPRGRLTREQLSALLLTYVGNAADILDLFSAFEEPNLSVEEKVTIAVLVLYTWSLYQFCLVTTATTERKNEKALLGNGVMTLKNAMRNRIRPLSRVSSVSSDKQADKEVALKMGVRALNSARVKATRDRFQPFRRSSGKELNENGDLKRDYIGSIRSSTRSSTDRTRRGKGRKGVLPPLNLQPTPINVGATDQCEQKIKRRKMHGEMFQILVIMFMQDGPFFVLRLYLIVQYEVYSEMHLFFTVKNLIFLLLLVYRLLILSCSAEDEAETMWHREEAEIKLHNIQVAIKNMRLGDIEVGRISVK